ncbi:MAG: translocation/assembly module TamB [Proteobacteria bacterium]|nr:translocation/assembly module TamB [Pseudomonadota bacterium]MBU1687359.1 translocation/assembly module TamB [Pseudomonadota bacterium]
MKIKLSIIILGCILAATGSIFGLRDRILPPLIVSAVQAKLGMEITVAAVSGSFIRDLRISGLRTTRPAPDGPLVSIGANTIQARYSLPLLFHGFDSFLSDLRLELDGARVEMDFARTQGQNATPPSPASNFLLPIIRAQNTLIDLQGPEWSVLLSGTDLTVTSANPGQGGIPVTVHATQSKINIPALHPWAGELSAIGILSRYGVVINTLTSDNHPVISKAHLTYGPQEPFGFNLSFSAFNGHGTVNGTLEPGDMTLGWDIPTVDLSKVTRRLRTTQPLPQGILTSRGTLKGNFSDPASLSGGISLTINEGLFREIPFQRFAITGTSATGILTVDSFDLKIGENSLTASRLSTPQAMLVPVDLAGLAANSTGDFSVRLQNLPSLLQLLGIPEENLPGDIPVHRILISGAADHGVLHIKSLSATMPGNVLSASGVETPLAALVDGNTESTIENTKGSFSARLEDIPSLLRLAGMPAEQLPSGLPTHRLEVTGQASKDGIILKSGTFKGADATVTLQRCEITLPSTGPLLKGLGLIVRLVADIPDLDRIGPIMGLTETGGSLKVAMNLEGALGAPKGSVDITGNNLRYRKIAVDTFSLAARSGSTGWQIETFETAKGKDHLSGHGIMTTNPFRFKDATLDLQIDDIGLYDQWFSIDDGRVQRGSLSAHLEGAGIPSALEGSFTVHLADALISGVAISQGDLTGSLTGDSIDITWFSAETSEGQVSLAGSFLHQAWGLPVSGTIHQLDLGREGLKLVLTNPVPVQIEGASSWSFGKATLRGEAGELMMSGVLSAQTGYTISVEARGVESAPLKPFLKELPIEFHGLNLSGQISGNVDMPEISLVGSVKELRAPGADIPLTGHLELSLSSGGILLKTFSWETANGEQILLSGTLPYDLFTRKFIPGSIELQSTFTVPDLVTFTAFFPERYHVPGALTGTVNISGTADHPEAIFDFKATKIRFPAWSPLHPPGAVTMHAAGFLKNNTLRLSALTADSTEFNISLSGGWDGLGTIPKKLPVAAELPGSLALTGAFSFSELGWLGKSTSAIRRLGGNLAGTLAVSGPAANPVIAAELTLTDGELRPDSSMPALRNLQVQVRIDHRLVTIDHFAGTVGGSPFTASGTVNIPALGAPQADLQIQGSNILLYRSEAVGIRADADIMIQGTITAPAISGTVAITDGRLRKNINWLAPLKELSHGKLPLLETSNKPTTPGIGISFPNPPLRDATFDIHLVSKNPFVVRSNVARGTLRPDLRLTGTGEIPVLTGLIYVDPSRVLLPAGRLKIESGLIRFPENGSGRPVLEINGSSRILGYDINLSVEGPYDAPTVTLSSAPPLPQHALLLLLLTGKIPAGVTDQSGGWQGGMKIALYVSKGIIDEWFGEDTLDGGESMLERLDIVAGRGISRQGNETIGAQYLMAEGVVLERDELYLVAERDIYDEFNAGVRIVFQFK